MNKSLFEKAVFAVLGLLMSAAASAAQYSLFLQAVGGAHGGEFLWDIDPVTYNAINLSTVDVAEVITWGSPGTTGEFAATAISIDYFGTTYDLSDALAPVTVQWVDGSVVAVNYTTAAFTLEIVATPNPKEWEGFVHVSEVPVPGAMLLFASALGLLGVRSRFAA